VSTENSVATESDKMIVRFLITSKFILFRFNYFDGNLSSVIKHLDVVDSTKQHS